MDVLSRWKRFRIDGVFLALLCISPLTLFFSPSLGRAEEADELQVEPSSSAPYVVFVAEPSAFARCGPSPDHYRTESLRRGQELEVYVETADGWLGIRPPEESFCWMPAESVELSDDRQTATILEDETIAWIGTQLGQARRYRWQVQLNAGESVSIIGQTDRQGADGTKTWLRIVPPPGEFRWIHRDQIVESAEQLAQKLADSLTPQKQPTEIPTVAMEDTATVQEDESPTLVPIINRDIAQTGTLDASGSNPTGLSNSTTRRGTDALREANEIPELRPAPTQSDGATAMGAMPERSQVADRAIQFLRGASADEYEDRGAVIGSGLKNEWQEDSDQVSGEYLSDIDDSESVLSSDRLTELPASGAAVAASALAAPLRRVTDVVANFISPPRLVEINSTRPTGYADASPADRRWMVGSRRTFDSQSPLTPPRSLATSQLGSHSISGGQVVQTSAIETISRASDLESGNAGGRTISSAQITRVEDAIADADLDVVSQVLSRLMAEGASADELDPLIRRTEQLLRSGDVNRATRTRALLDRAQQYRNLAARRDGVTTIESMVLSKGNQPALAPLRGPEAGQVIQQQAADHDAPNAGESEWSGADVIETPLGPVAGAATGFLVQVYSSRANSPPYALTDDAGLTVAYVTPYPGVNLRNHLNSRIAVRGNEKMLEGMSTPHILVDRAIRR